MSASKKLNQGIGFGASNNKKDNDEQSNSIITTLDTALDSTVHNDLASKLNNNLDSVQSSALVGGLDRNLDPKLDTSMSRSIHTVVDSIPSTGKSTFQIPSKSEPFSKRLVANVTPSQKLFVQEMSKKFENESSFVRFMIQRFMEDIEITEGE